MIEINDTTLIEFLEGKLDNAATAEVERWYDASEANRRHLEQLYFVLFTGDRLSAAQAVNPEYGWQALRRKGMPWMRNTTCVNPEQSMPIASFPPHK